MTNTVKHIALQVSDKDVNSFYIDVLNGEITHTFELSKEDSFEIFNINNNVMVSQMSCEGIDFELFVDSKHQSPTFAHVCFQSFQAKEIFEKAKLNGYHTCVRNNNSSPTYFVSDTNSNLFEIKTKELGVKNIVKK